MQTEFSHGLWHRKAAYRTLHGHRFLMKSLQLWKFVCVHPTYRCGFEVVIYLHGWLGSLGQLVLVTAREAWTCGWPGSLGQLVLVTTREAWMCGWSGSLGQLVLVTAREAWTCGWPGSLGQLVLVTAREAWMCGWPGSLGQLVLVMAKEAWMCGWPGSSALEWCIEKQSVVIPHQALGPAFPGVRQRLFEAGLLPVQGIDQWSTAVQPLCWQMRRKKNVLFPITWAILSEWRNPKHIIGTLFSAKLKQLAVPLSLR